MMGEEIDLAAKAIGESSGAVVTAAIEASGVDKPMKEVTGWLASWIHPRLEVSAAKQLMKAVDKLKRLGITPGAVRDEQIRLLIEEGAREEDESLREKWANLLANGVVAGANGVPRAYAEILRQLEPTDALLLDRMASGTLRVDGSDGGTRVGRGDVEGTNINGSRNLERLGLITLGPSPGPPSIVRTPSGVETLRTLSITLFGLGFYEACSEPKPPESRPED